MRARACVCVLKQGLALNNQQWLMCHKNQTKPKQTKQIYRKKINIDRRFMNV